MLSELLRMIRIYNSNVDGLDCDLAANSRRVSITKPPGSSWITIVAFENDVHIGSQENVTSDDVADWLRWMAGASENPPC